MPLISAIDAFLDLSHTKRRLMLLFAVVAYIGGYQFLYVTWLSPAYFYMGFTYFPPQPSMLLLAWILGILPIFWSPIQLTRPSQLLYWVLYFIVYVPSMFIPIYVQLSSLEDIVKLMVALFCGFSILAMTYLFPIPRFRNDLVPSLVFWIGIIMFIIGLSAWVVTVFKGNFHLVSFGDVYELRADADTIIGTSKVSYAIAWLTGSINPFLMALGLVNKRRLLFWAGFGGEIFLYSAGGNKIAILSPVIIVCLYLLLRKRTDTFAIRLSWMLVAALVCLYVVYLGLVTTENTVLNFILGIALMRTLGSPGLFSAQYYAFFHSHPHTYFSHVTGINQLIRYPYQKVLGLEMGQYYMGLFDLNFNAHFWATDGIAGFGLAGVILISVFCAALFWILDAAAWGHKPVLPALALTFAAADLCNTSLFTTLFSGGVFLSILMLMFSPRSQPSPQRSEDLIGHPAQIAIRRAAENRSDRA